MSWTDDRVEILKTMWGEGKSASQIAKELGGVTRNAVIGKVHRLGLSNRASPAAKASAKPKSASKSEATAKPSPKPSKTEATEEPAAKPVTLPMRKPIIRAGQPLPPQPSANEVSAEALANVKEIEKTAKRLKLMELTERVCKWPIGDPATDDFWFCGHAVQQGKPYCEAHVAVAFQPMSARRDRRASR
jgi:GcrA cell cycle regulator